jgi:hypothetical protein
MASWLLSVNKFDSPIAFAMAPHHPTISAVVPFPDPERAA